MTESQTATVSLAIRVEGRVQGVGYRVSARRTADALGIEADPVNLDDGSVRIIVAGARGPVARFVEWCHHGPDEAEVTAVTTTGIH